MKNHANVASTLRCGQGHPAFQEATRSRELVLPFEATRSREVVLPIRPPADAGGSPFTFPAVRWRE